ncbi:hypothetical protein J7I44_01705 [Frateuria sp. MAH-13]|uniref:Uncharacterized protein n=1 Tax=Frateuria flava TaxID=2821489 RepID=A0ABS4DIY7_9GAMM|nr:hypothetical protein [Frateuria flava]MBP1472995.1 hypothetical protein [Frateuria flava]
MIDTQLNLLDFDRPFARFSELIGAHVWRSRVRLIRQAVAGNPYAEGYLTKENELCLALEELTDISERMGRFPLTLRKKRHLFFAMAFVAQAVSLYEAVDELSGNQLFRRIVGAIKNDPEDVRALQVELIVATHFLRVGFKVVFPDLNGDERFDLLLRADDGREVEVECKFLSKDKGRKVHYRDLLDLYKDVAPFLRSYISASSTDLVIEVVVPDRFPSDLRLKKEIAKRIRDAVEGQQSAPDESLARILTRRPSPLDFQPSGKRDVDRAIFDEISGTNNKPVLFLRNAKGCFVLLVVASDKRDSIFESMYKTLSRAASCQLTHARPAIIAAALDDVRVPQLVRVAASEAGPDVAANTLQVIASRLMAARHNEHLVSVCFLSESELGVRTAGQTGSEGSVYYFNNEDSPYWGSGFDFGFSKLRA